MRAAVSGSGRAGTNVFGSVRVRADSGTAPPVRRPPPRGDDRTQGGQLTRQRQQVGRMMVAPVLGCRDHRDRLRSAQQRGRLTPAPPDREGQRHRTQSGERQVRDHGVAAVGQLDADDVTGVYPQAGEPGGQTSGLAVQSGITEFPLGVEDRRTMRVGDLTGAVEAVEIQVGAGPLHGPSTAQRGGQQVVQGDGHANLQGAGTAGEPWASRLIGPEESRSARSVTTGTAAVPLSCSRSSACAADR